MIGDEFKSDSCINNEAVYEIILEQQFIQVLYILHAVFIMMLRIIMIHSLIFYYT